MYITVIFILYMAAILISLVFLVFIGLIFVRKNERGNETYIAARRFALIVMLTNLLYFIFYYREIVREAFKIALPLRIVDYVLCIAIFLAWILLISKMMSGKLRKVFVVIGIALTALRLTVSLLVTSLYMDAYYSIDNSWVLSCWSGLEIGFILATALLIIFATVYALTEMSSRLRRNYIVICSGLLLFWSSIQGVVDLGLYAGRFGISAWELETPDFTGATMFLLNLATCIFVYKEDFSPLFFDMQNIKYEKYISDVSSREKFNESNELVTQWTEVSKLDAIAAVHKLTVREREVLELMYSGFTNPEIGEKLFISINTVKKHIHNIFEKMDVANRLELVHMINAWRSKN